MHQSFLFLFSQSYGHIGLHEDIVGTFRIIAAGSALCGERDYKAAAQMGHACKNIVKRVQIAAIAVLP